MNIHPFYLFVHLILDLVVKSRPVRVVYKTVHDLTHTLLLNSSLEIWERNFRLSLNLNSKTTFKGCKAFTAHVRNWDHSRSWSHYFQCTFSLPHNISVIYHSQEVYTVKYGRRATRVRVCACARERRVLAQRPFIKTLYS